MLLPHEHGAYGELLFPLAAALLIGPALVPALPWAIAAIAAFLMHEGLVVLLGIRGPRAKREQRTAAMRSLFAFGAIAVIAGAAAVTQLARDRWWSVAFAGFWAAAALIMTARRRERTLAGELIVAAALAALSVPVMIAAGQTARNAMTVWAVWTASFAALTPVVHVIVARTTRRPVATPLVTAVVLIAAAATASYTLWTRGTIDAAVPVALVPSFLCAVGLLVIPVKARALRTVGWTFVAAHAFTGAIVVSAFRGR